MAIHYLLDKIIHISPEKSNYVKYFPIFVKFVNFASHDTHEQIPEFDISGLIWNVSSGITITSSSTDKSTKQNVNPCKIQ